MKLNVNAAASVEFARKLERIHKSALPAAVRATLSAAALDVKKETMPDVAKRQFIERKPTFFKANSKVEFAKGYDLRTMKATVGFVGSDQAVEDLEQQEKGGNIGGRTYIPLAQARTGKNWRKNVRANARISDVKSKVLDAKDNKSGQNKKEQFVRSAIHAGKGGWVIGNNAKRQGNRYLFQIRSIVRKKGNTIVKAVPMFAVRKGRKVHAKATHFMERASQKSAQGMEKQFIVEAHKQLNRVR